MSVFKCKMCGATLNVTEKDKIVQCEYCFTQQTIPTQKNERITNLFNRANELRHNKDFDKSSGIYESIVAEYPNEAEAYWGLCLCKYGIEYVTDPATGRKMPTCHRTLTTSILNDPDFLQACCYSDEESKSLYYNEAQTIARIQKDIISIANTTEPCDIFICYKETNDISGSRTEDSIIAQDIYTELIKEGYKVFFARISLRDVAGTQYEPYIFSALSSSKVMLAIGTDSSYFNASWVKNEWSRFLNMMQHNSDKLLIPCYKNISPYQLPAEFNNLQALDISSVTFYKNLTDNLSRVFKKNTNKGTDSSQKATDRTQSNPNEQAEIYAYASKIKRDAEREFNPKKAEQAYNMFNKIRGYLDALTQANECVSLRKECYYQTGLRLMNTNPAQAIANFKEIYAYKDSAQLIERCKQQSAPGINVGELQKKLVDARTEKEAKEKRIGSIKKHTNIFWFISLLGFFLIGLSESITEPGVITETSSAIEEYGALCIMIAIFYGCIIYASYLNGKVWLACILFFTVFGPFLVVPIKKRSTIKKLNAEIVSLSAAVEQYTRELKHYHDTHRNMAGNANNMRR